MCPFPPAVDSFFCRHRRGAPVDVAQPGMVLAVLARQVKSSPFLADVMSKVCQNPPPKRPGTAPQSHKLQVPESVCRNHVVLTQIAEYIQVLVQACGQLKEGEVKS
jgi:hypothetical protein